ncbi:hypothetical protein RHSIM_Rhsim04G0148700 [Rhododendron simsii]|uniref:Uncharacterized protein n=1 Tax=Rhododendron simsii TaxID=118357 RepID=A0A834H5M4_RHOSS|nr:hypothetical protein RHSIM_Rhsim04G0148700 [Rhododendron simsii]
MAWPVGLQSNQTSHCFLHQANVHTSRVVLPPQIFQCPWIMQLTMEQGPYYNIGDIKRSEVLALVCFDLSRFIQYNPTGRVIVFFFLIGTGRVIVADLKARIAR